jgi:hypothetical protein
MAVCNSVLPFLEAKFCCVPSRVYQIRVCSGWKKGCGTLLHLWLKEWTICEGCKAKSNKMRLYNNICNFFYVLFTITNIIQVWRWKQYIPPKCWYVPIRPHGVTTEQANNGHVNDPQIKFLHPHDISDKGRFLLNPGLPVDSSPLVSSELICKYARCERKYNSELFLCTY